MSEENLKIENPVGTKPVGQLIRQFSIPSIIAMLVSSLYNIVDQIFIGQGVGYLGNAATTVSFPLTSLCLAIALLIGVGSASVFSLELGRGNKENAAKAAGSAICLMVILGLAYLILGQIFLPPMLNAFGATEANYPLAIAYSRPILTGMPILIMVNAMSNLIRADGSPVYSMTMMVAGAIVNCILDPIFIFGFGWGMAGAAWATVIGQLVSFGLAMAYLPKFKSIELKPSLVRLHPKITLFTIKLGLAASLNQIAILLAQIVMNNLLKKYGLASVYGPDIPIAASGVGFKLSNLYVAVMVGLAQGIQPIIGFNYGAGKYARVRKTLTLSMLTLLCTGIVVELMFQLMPEPLILIFGHGDELYLEFGVKFLRIYMVAIAIQGIQALSSNYFAAIDQPVKGIILSLSRTIIFFAPLAFLFGELWGMDGLLLSQPAADVIAVTLSVILVSISFSKMKKLEKEHAIAPIAE